jgi:subfamily B ATP-binding cassette protein MsbA
MNVIFSTIKISTLIPVLQVLFNEEALEKSYEAPAFAWSLGYARDFFYFHFSNYLHEYGRLSALYLICGLVISTFFISNVFGFIASITMNRIRIRVITNLRKKVFENILRLDLAQFTASRKGDIMARTTTDVQQLETSVVGVFYIFFRDPLFVIGYFVALVFISPELTLYTLAILPLSAGLISFLTKRMRRSARRSQDTLSSITSLLDETIFGIRIVKSFAAARYAFDRFSKEIHRYGLYDYKIAFGRSMAHPTSEFLGTIFMSLVLIKGGVMVFEGELTAATFIGFLLLFSQVLNPAKSISKAVGELPRGIAAGQRVFELIDKVPTICNRPGAKVIKDVEKVSLIIRIG